jgi:hypothetical protein
MDSHEYAARIQAEAKYLLDKPPFEMPTYTGLIKEFYWYMGDKAGFVAAVRALGTGEKQIGVEYVEFHPVDAPIAIRIERQHVCKLIEPAKYDCEPFLGPEEDAVIDAAAAATTTEVNEIPF